MNEMADLWIESSGQRRFGATSRSLQINKALWAMPTQKSIKA
jgi:hypothetical protein